MLARRAAEYADNMLFSDDFRLEAVDCLRDLIESMKGQAEGDADEIDDDSRNSRKDTITMALTTNSLSFGDNGDARQGDSAASATAKAIQSPGVTRQESLANQAKVAGPGTDTPTTAFLDGSSLGEAKQL